MAHFRFEGTRHRVKAVWLRSHGQDRGGSKRQDLVREGKGTRIYWGFPTDTFQAFTHSSIHTALEQICTQHLLCQVHSVVLYIGVRLRGCLGRWGKWNIFAERKESHTERPSWKGIG